MAPDQSRCPGKHGRARHQNFSLAKVGDELGLLRRDGELCGGVAECESCGIAAKHKACAQQQHGVKNVLHAMFLDNERREKQHQLAHLAVRESLILWTHASG